MRTGKLTINSRLGLRKIARIACERPRRSAASSNFTTAISYGLITSIAIQKTSSVSTCTGQLCHTADEAPLLRRINGVNATPFYLTIIRLYSQESPPIAGRAYTCLYYCQYIILNTELSSVLRMKPPVDGISVKVL